MGQDRRGSDLPPTKHGVKANSMKSSILVKLALFVALVIVLSATAISWTGYQFARNRLTEQIHQRLQVVAYDRALMLNNYVAQQKERVRLVASRTQLRLNLQRRLAEPASVPSFYRDTQRIMHDAQTSTPIIGEDDKGQKIYEFLDIWVTDPQGVVVASTNADYLETNFGDNEDYKQGLKEAHLGTPRFEGDRVLAYLTAPAKADDGMLLGVFMVLLDLGRLLELRSDRTGLGDTGEVRVATLKNGTVRYLIPTEEERASATVAAEHVPAMVKAIRNDRPDFDISQYEGKQVLAAWRQVNYQSRDFQPWGMVVKLDADEAYRPIARLTRTVWILEFFLVILGILVAYVLAKRFTRPILKMAETVTKVSENNIRVQVDVNSSDEIGALARAFNEMTERLAHLYATLEQQVHERTDQLETANARLERTNEELKDFAHIVSHDLKEPLRGISSYANFISEDFGEKVGDDGKVMLDTMKRLCVRMEELISSLLDYSRAGTAELSLQRTDLNELLAEVIDSMHVSIKEENAKINIPRQLPTIRCDRVCVGEIFRNLITNAYKYNNSLEKAIVIGIDDNGQNGNAGHSGIKPVFYVRDNGIGISEKHLESVFRMFRRLHTKEKYGGGTGAGLALAKKLVERHGGKIWVESKLGEGSAFYFTLDR